jgi:putative ABC transport system permease protein
MLRNYLKIAIRNLTRNKVFSLVNIAGLSLGLTCCMLIVLYTKDERSFDRFQVNKDQLYRIKVRMDDANGSRVLGSTNAIHGLAFKAEIPDIKEVVRMQSGTFVVKTDHDLLNQDALFADDNFFSVFSMPLIYGDPTIVLKELHSIVITAQTAEKYFNTLDAVGKTLDFKIGEKFETFIVSGVAKNCPQNSSVQFDVIIPFRLQEVKGWTDTAWLGFYMNTFILLNEKASYLAVIPKMNQVFASKAANEIGKIRDFKQEIYFQLQPFLAIHFDSEVSDLRNGLGRGSSSIYAYMLSGIAIFILLIACINFVNLTVARSLKRAKEVGIRKVVGSQRKQLVLQFLGESFFLSFLAFTCAVLLTLLVLPSFNVLANKQLSFSYLLDTGLVSGYAALFCVTGLLAGCYPALILSGFSPAQTLYNRTKLVRKNYLTKGLVVFQFVLSVCLVIGTIVVYAQFEYLTNKNLGYNDKNLLSFSLGRGGAGGEVLDVVKEELAGMAGVQSVAAFNGNYNETVALTETGEISFGYIGVDDNFLNTLQIPLVTGRNFSKQFGSDPVRSVIVNEAFVKEAGWENPIGQEVNFTWKKERLNVIGVIKDYHFASLKEKIKPLLLTQDPKYSLSTIYAKINSGDIPATTKAIEKIFRQQIPYLPFEYKFEDLKNIKRYEAEAKWKQIITLAALLSVFVSCMGLFGLATFSSETRLKEIGIRKVLGASVGSIVRQLSVDFLRLVLIAILIAIPLSYYGASIWLEEFPYKVGVSWWYFGLAALLAVVVALMTVGTQAVKSGLMNPVKALRSE